MSREVRGQIEERWQQDATATAKIDDQEHDTSGSGPGGGPFAGRPRRADSGGTLSKNDLLNVHASPPLDPRRRRASQISRCMMVTRFAWIAHRLLFAAGQYVNVRQFVVPRRIIIAPTALTRLRTYAPRTPPLLPAAQESRNFATVDQCRRNRSCLSSCPARSRAPVRRVSLSINASSLAPCAASATQPRGDRPPQGGRV